MTKQEKKTITIDGKEHDLNDLSEKARQQIFNLRMTDQEIEHLQQRLAIAQTARTSYSRALEAELPKKQAH